MFRTTAGTFATLVLLLFAGGQQAAAEGAEAEIISDLEARHGEYSGVARRIWDLAELGYQEAQSSALLQEKLRGAGFAVEAGVAAIPTAFVASHGEGKPVIGILAEFDALPGISQGAVAQPQGLPGKNSAHACGHNLFGAASMAAAIAIKDWLAETGRPGTIRLYGTPAEEGGSGKVYMTRAGLFDDVDAVLNWHPSDRNDASPVTTLANRSAKFRFHGVSSHAAVAPEKGRSALDGVEAMNHMVNLLREHVPRDSRIHYVITDGGAAPNVVPGKAEVFYYVRHPDPRVLEGIWDRVVAAAQGAARGTGTTMDFEIIHGNHSLLPNETLAKLMDANLRRVGGIGYTRAEQDFAERVFASLDAPKRGLGSERTIQPFALQQRYGSTDVGDVSWAVPTAGLATATWVPGTVAHTWQAAAASGMSIGFAGMSVAAKTMTLTALDLFTEPANLAAAWAEFDERRGPDYTYYAILGERDPPLDYRK